MPQVPTYYETLQVDPSADEEVIQAAARALLKKHHPDTGGSNETTKRILEARDVLCDPVRRREHDLQLIRGQWGFRQRSGSEGGGPSPRSDDAPQAHRATSPRDDADEAPGKDLRGWTWACLVLAVLWILLGLRDGFVGSWGVLPAVGECYILVWLFWKVRRNHLLSARQRSESVTLGCLLPTVLYLLAVAAFLVLSHNRERSPQADRAAVGSQSRAVSESASKDSSGSPMAGGNDRRNARQVHPADQATEPDWEEQLMAEASDPEPPSAELFPDGQPSFRQVWDSQPGQGERGLNRTFLAYDSDSRKVLLGEATESGSISRWYRLASDVAIRRGTEGATTGDLRPGTRVWVILPTRVDGMILRIWLLSRSRVAGQTTPPRGERLYSLDDIPPLDDPVPGPTPKFVDGRLYSDDDVLNALGIPPDPSPSPPPQPGGFAALWDEPSPTTDPKPLKGNAPQRSEALASQHSRNAIGDHSGEGQPPSQTTGAGTVPQKLLRLDLGHGVVMDLVLITGGTFLMGSPLEDPSRSPDEIPHQAAVSDYYMARTEVTWEQWSAIMPPSFPGTEVGGKFAHYPATNVSFLQTSTFCRKLSDSTGREVSLPSEAQWEYACRAGTSSPSPFSWGADSSELRKYAWAGEDDLQEAGRKLPNAFGLFDMLGNAWEMSADWYGEYSTEGRLDSNGPASGRERVVRGGSVQNVADSCRCAQRGKTKQETTGELIGFRVIITP